MTNINEYQKTVTKVKKYSSNPELYLLAKLTEETGEVAKEIIRKVDGRTVQRDLKSELGDLLWCISAIGENYGITLEEVIEDNLQKLKNRDLL